MGADVAAIVILAILVDLLLIFFLSTRAVLEKAGARYAAAQSHGHDYGESGEDGSNDRKRGARAAYSSRKSSARSGEAKVAYWSVVSVVLGCVDSLVFSTPPPPPRTIPSSNKPPFSGNRWSRWRVRAFQHRRRSTSCVLVGQQRSSRSKTIRRSYNTLYKWDSHPAARPAESFSSVNGQQMPTFPVKRPRHHRSIQCTAVQELHYVARSHAGPARVEHHYLADSDSLCLEAPSAGQLYLLLSRLRDCSLRLGRVAEGTPQAVSPWSAFNASFFQNIPAHQSQRSYICKTFRADTMLLLLMFHSAATCQSFLLLWRTWRLCTGHDVVMFGSHSIEPETCDTYGGPGVAIYCKAQEIRWKHPCKFQNVVLRMGAFHTVTAFLTVLGKPFGDAGLQDDSLKNTLLLLLLLLLQYTNWKHKHKPREYTLLLLLLLLLLEYNNDTQIEKTSTNLHILTNLLHKSSSSSCCSSSPSYFWSGFTSTSCFSVLC